MSLFVKKTPETGTNAPLFTLGSEKSLLIVGLGNIGKEYEGSRHNIGFACVDSFAKQQDFPAWHEKKDLKCHLTQHRLGETRVILMKPQTFMNNSGEAVSAVQRFYKLANSQTLVVHDELDIDFGQIRMRIDGGSAGNNGVKSLIQHCGEDFGRLRIGIKSDLLSKVNGADFVLAKFNKEEQAHLSALLREVNNILLEYTYKNEQISGTRSFLV